MCETEPRDKPKKTNLNGLQIGRTDVLKIRDPIIARVPFGFLVEAFPSRLFSLADCSMCNGGG